MELVRQIIDGKSYNFKTVALELFNFQFQNNPIYRKWAEGINCNPDTVRTIKDIPFLPVEIFKTQKVITGSEDASLIFRSSGTTMMSRSKHYVVDPELYELSFTKAFEYFYGAAEQYRICCLLPSYHEAGDSSLVYMCQHLINQSGHEESGFYYGRESILLERLEDNSKVPTILFGVTYALLDLAAKLKSKIPNTIIIETGGMKGRRKEILREEVHDCLINATNCTSIHSEYGMTELLSQAYSAGNGIFRCPHWMKVLVREQDDPFSIVSENQSGLINIIDFANIHSCCFLATQDIGKLKADGSFEVLGRSDLSDVRGCNLLIQ